MFQSITSEKYPAVNFNIFLSAGRQSCLKPAFLSSRHHRPILRLGEKGYNLGSISMSLVVACPINLGTRRTVGKVQCFRNSLQCKAGLITG